MDVIRHFIVFEASKHEDSKGIISIRTVKKMAAITSTTRLMSSTFHYSCLRCKCSSLCRSSTAPAGT
ncbi:hypothetical protein ACVXHA_25715 [Escherichia coli]